MVLRETIKSAGFSLRKFSSNVPQLLNPALPSELITKDVFVKFTGIIWDTVNDTLSFPSPKFSPRFAMTKVQLLSEISKIFDPLGFAQPIIIKAKMLMQSIWKLQLKWEDQVPVMDQWEEIRVSLNCLDNIIIPRWNTFSTLHSTEIHAFCDASQSAYGAVVYFKSPLGVRLLISKQQQQFLDYN